MYVINIYIYILRAVCTCTWEHALGKHMYRKWLHEAVYYHVDCAKFIHK